MRNFQLKKTLNSYIPIESGFMNALKIKMVQHTNSICYWNEQEHEHDTFQKYTCAVFSTSLSLFSFVCFFSAEFSFIENCNLPCVSVDLNCIWHIFVRLQCFADEHWRWHPGRKAIYCIEYLFMSKWRRRRTSR